MEALAAAAFDVNQAWLALGSEVFEADLGVLVRNGAVPARRDSYHVEQIRAVTLGEIDRLLARSDEEFAGFPHRAYADTPKRMYAARASGRLR